MKTIVTSGAGFIGSHLCDLLLSKGCEVICVDNLVTGDMKNISHLSNIDKFSFVKHDIVEPLYLEENIDFMGQVQELYFKNFQKLR